MKQGQNLFLLLLVLESHCNIRIRKNILNYGYVSITKDTYFKCVFLLQNLLTQVKKLFNTSVVSRSDSEVKKTKFDILVLQKPLYHDKIANNNNLDSFHLLSHSKRLKAILEYARASR